MLDNFREEIVVKRNKGLNSFLYSLCWIGIILFGFIGFMGLSGIMAMNFEVTNFILLGVFGGAAFLLWRYKDNLRTEYEYSFTNGDLDVSKVLGNSRRKYLTAINMKNLEAAGSVTHQSFQRYITMKDVKRHNWFLNREANLQYCYFTKNNVKHIIVIEPTSTMIDLMRKYCNYGIWNG